MISQTAAGAILDWLFLATDWADLSGDFYIHLHTASPAGGDSSTNELTYTGYARVAVTRDLAGFTRSGDEVSNAAVIRFPSCSGGFDTATHFSVCLGGGAIVMSSALDAAMPISSGIQPEFEIGALVATVG